MIPILLTLSEFDAAAAEADRLIPLGCMCRLMPFPQRDALSCPWHRTYFDLMRRRRLELERRPRHYEE